MDRSTAVDEIRRLIAAHRGVDRIRFLLNPRTGLSVITLGPNTQTRVKHTQEQRELVRYLSDGPGLESLEVFYALDPTLLCTFGSGFDVDVAGTISNRHGSRARLSRALRQTDEDRWAQMLTTGFQRRNCW